MDRMIYLGMGGAKQAMEQQAVVANNMANISTSGFRAQINNLRAVPVVGDELQTRSMVVATTPGADMREGSVTQTGRPLDVAIRGDGWLAVQTPDGNEAYTRAGSLQVDSDGQLTSMDGNPIVGDSGPIVIPPGATVSISSDGMISALLAGNTQTGASEVGRLKLVNPPTGEIERGDDGLFRTKAGAPAAQADPAVKVSSGAIEGSNVNAVDAMVAMIANARRFEMHMKTIQAAESNDQQANKLLSTT